MKPKSTIKPENAEEGSAERQEQNTLVAENVKLVRLCQTLMCALESVIEYTGHDASCKHWQQHGHCDCGLNEVDFAAHKAIQDAENHGIAIPRKT